LRSIFFGLGGEVVQLAIAPKPRTHTAITSIDVGGSGRIEFMNILEQWIVKNYPSLKP
jgi:hypothetical protein